MTVQADVPVRRSKPQWQRSLTRALKAIVVGVPFAYFLPKIFALFAVCGLYDVTRNKRINGALFSRYFMGNGVLTWVVSPLNTLLDILCLPYWNKGVYKLEDLPPAYQQELRQVFDAAISTNLAAKLEDKTRGLPRAMFFFKWYGTNVQNDLVVPAFHENYKYVQTIGVSVFNKREVTNEHFGFMRASLRVLYNINEMKDRSAYIEVGPAVSYWQDEKLFIFDDTLLHLSANNSDQPRYCMFIDIVRPTYLPGVMRGVMRLTGLLSRPFNYVFYNKWKLVKA